MLDDDGEQASNVGPRRTDFATSESTEKIWPAYKRVKRRTDFEFRLEDRIRRGSRKVEVEVDHPPKWRSLYALTQPHSPFLHRTG